MSPQDEPEPQAPAPQAGRLKKFATFAGFVGLWVVVFSAASHVFAGNGASETAPSWLGGSEIAALLVAAFYILTGLACLLGIASPKNVPQMQDAQLRQPDANQRKMLISAGLYSGAVGIALGVLACAGSGGIIGPLWAGVLFAALMIFGAVMYLVQLKENDAEMKLATTEAAMIAYYLMVAIGGGWSALGHLGIISGPAALDWLTMFWAAAMIGAIWASARRGLITRADLAKSV